MTTESAEWNGIAASPGYAMAKAVVLSSQAYVPERREIGDPAAEQKRFKTAVAAAEEELEAIIRAALERFGESKAEIFEGHRMLLGDPEFSGAILAKIEEQKLNAEYALYEIARMYIDMFAEMDTELLQARSADIEDVAERVMNHLRGVKSDDLAAITEDCVIVAGDLKPSDTARINPQLVKGIILAAGSRTSHSAIMARSLEIPAVTGAGEAVLQIPAGAMVIVDAMEGIVIAHPSPAQIAEYREKQKRYEVRKAELLELRDKSTFTRDGHRIELGANIGNLEDLEQVLANGAEGIGLFRTEFLYMERTSPPSEEEQFNIYKHVLEKMSGKPVVIRTLDVGGDKDIPYLGLPEEDNPFLGQRALRFCLAKEDLFRTQLRALLRAGVYGELKIMFPMIAVYEEWREARRMLDEERQRLVEAGIAVPERLEVGMMVEVPAAALSAGIFAEEADFFSIGTNDLIQYMMAADRTNESVSYLYQPCHPGLIRLIAMVAEAAHQANKWVGMCGEMAGDPAAIPLLVGLGLDELSMSATSILPARELVARISREQAARLVEQILTLKTEQEVQAQVSAFLQAKEGA